jgi:putative spermidine/putrescine transport system ATP-binding protein
VNIQGVTKRYAQTVAVDDIRIDIREAEFLTLLGPSGSGKTTLLMIIAGFIEPDKGRIIIGGRDVTKVQPHRRDIGVVFQNYALFPHMTALENIEYPLKMRRMTQKEMRRKTGKIIDVVKLQGMKDRKPHQLSGGQQQRVALARALVFDPPVLLMDEPLSALDKNLREHMQLELKHIQKQLGITVLYVTHDQEEALIMSDRIAIMNQGRIEQNGTAHKIYDFPVNRFVAEFMGETNLFQTRIIGTEKIAVLTQGPDGQAIAVKTEKPFRIGQKGYLSIRPEKVAFIDDGYRPSCLYQGMIEEIIYLGDCVKYYVRLIHENTLKENNRVVVKVQNRKEAYRYNRGDSVRIGWSEDDVILV